jgi:hypothetical protein
MGSWRRILANRFVLVPGLIAMVVIAWNAYVFTHNHGIVVGEVVDSSGRPVAGATAALWVYNFTTYEEKEHVTTDANGMFRFANNPSHRIQVSAEKPGVGRSDRQLIFLYCPSEDTTLAQPLRLAQGG